MKIRLKNFLKTPMVLVLLFIVFTYTFSAFGASAEINKYAVVTAIGIDRSNDIDKQFEISLLTFVPVAEQSFTETYKVVSAKGKSISEAMDFAGLYIGRQVGLSHVKLVIMNTDLLNEDITKFLDYLSRSKHMSSSTKLIATNSPVKNFLEAAKSLNSESSIKISELITYNLEYIYATDSSFETFFKGLLGPTKVSFIPFLRLDKKLDDGIAVDSESSSGDNKDKGEGSSKEEIVNDGETIVFKDGKAVLKLDSYDMKKVNLLSGTFNTGSIEVTNITDDNFSDANLIFEIYDKKIKRKVTFENGIPIINIDMTLNLSLSEVENKNHIIEENVEFFTVSNQTIKAIETKVKNSVSEAITIMRKNKVDLSNFYTTIYNSNKSKFLKFLDGLVDENDFLDNIVFKICIKVNSK